MPDTSPVREQSSHKARCTASVPRPAGEPAKVPRSIGHVVRPGFDKSLAAQRIDPVELAPFVVGKVGSSRIEKPLTFDHGT